MMSFDPDRFVDAQDRVYERVLDELRAGRKQSHWMWFIFPQVAGLGVSEISQRFAIPDLETAQDYAQHPVLGARMIECTELALSHSEKAASMIFGTVDAMKFRSSMTLFNSLPVRHQVFQAALLEFYGGRPDRATLEILTQQTKN